MTREQQVDALRKAADAHYVLLTQNKRHTQDTCQANYTNLDDGGAPAEYGASSAVANSK
jgi:hypothetical protein